MLKRIRSERGFTLVELLVVLAVLAILIAIVVPNLAGITGGAQEVACGQELDTVQAAMDTLMADNSAMSVTAGDEATLSGSTEVTYWLWDGTHDTDTLSLRDSTDGTYSWDTTGAITQDSCP
jgi:type IV pilus assembly protein PilA